MRGQGRKKGSKAKPKPLPIEVNKQEYADLMTATKFMRHKVAFMLAFESGLRISEVVNLKKEDFDIPNKQIRVNMGKNSKDRIVPLPKCWKHHLINYIPLPCRQRALQEAFQKYAKLSGLKDLKPKVHFHSLRHGFATECLRSGVPLISISALLGHEDISTTQIYINLCPKEHLDHYEKGFLEVKK